jgi:hypothetical protein
MGNKAWQQWEPRNLLDLQITKKRTHSMVIGERHCQTALMGKGIKDSVRQILMYSGLHFSHSAASRLRMTFWRRGENQGEVSITL